MTKCDIICRNNEATFEYNNLKVCKECGDILTLGGSKAKKTYIKK